MSSRVLFVTAALAVAAILMPAFTASAKDDPAAKKAARDKVRADLKAKGFYFTHDLSYSVDTAKLKESRWDWKDPPPFHEVSEEKGGQFLAKFAPSSGGEVGITVSVVKYPHYQMVGPSTRQPFSLPFKSWGKDVPCSKADDIAMGVYEDWILEAADVIKDKCKKTKTRKLGPAEFFATAVGTDKEDKVRQRQMWFVWSTTGAEIPCTWVAKAVIAEKFIDTEEVIKKAEDMIAYMKEVKK